MFAATQSPAKRFYVTPKHALAIYRQFRQCGNMAWLSPRMRCMFRDLFDEYELRCTAAKVAQRQTGKQWNAEDIMDMAIKQPAPSFYLEPKSALNYYYRSLNNRRKRNKQ